MSGSYAVEPMDLAWIQRTVRCRHTCPVNTNAGGYIALIARGRFDEAYALASEPNPLVNVCARVCARPCEKACRRGQVDEPVAICALKRFAYDNRGQARPVKKAPPRPEQVAVIGSGPAGLACAHDLAVQGYPVTIFEAATVAGGQLKLGLPHYRLPREIVDEDIERVRSLGVAIRLGQSLGREFTLGDLREQGYKAVFLAVGACRSRELRIPGTDLPQALRGVEFLAAVNQGFAVPLGRRVIVVGGGNVAMDVARTAARCPERPEVHVVCLEAEHEMPADREEVEALADESIHLHNRLGPKAIVGEAGRVSGLLTQRVARVFDETGRFNPSFVENSESTLPCDTVILAIGQTSDLSFLQPGDGVKVTPRGTIAVDPESLATDVPGIFAGGDAAAGPGIIIGAVAAGRKAARSIQEYLSGRRKVFRTVLEQTPVPWLRAEDDYHRTERQEASLLDPDRRGPKDEVDQGLFPPQAMAEAQRCLQCFINPWLDPDACILCGGCVDVCPYACLSIVPAGQTTGPGLNGVAAGNTVMIKDDDLCIRCGLCSNRCPTGAMSMQRFDWKEELVDVR